MTRTAAVLLLLLAPGGRLQAQDPEAKILQELNFANDPTKLAFQGQAIDRLRKRGAAVAPHLVAWVKVKGHNALSRFCTELMGDIADPALADLAAELVEDKSFFWRASAAKALAAQKSSRHLELQRRNLSDHIWGVRAGGVAGLEKLGDKESAPAMAKLLDDPTPDVRAAAAKALHRFGDPSGLGVLVAALRADVRWFDIDYGQLAREDACDFLKTLNGGDDFGFKAWETEEQRAPGLRKWEDWMTARQADWRGKLPPNARIEADTATYLFGFELRSCQRGDYFFRLDTRGNLVVGFFNLSRHPLTPEERAKLDAAVAEVRQVKRGVPYGQGGCDFEQYYLGNGAGKYDRLWVGLRGRPGELDGFIQTAADLLKAKLGDGEGREFRERTAIFREMN